MNDPYAPIMVLECVREERSQFFLGLGHCETVQVDFGLHPVLAAAKLSQNPVLDPLAGEHELFSARKLRISRVTVQALLQHCKAVGTGKASTGWGRATGLSHWSFLREGFDILYRLAEEAGVILIGLRIHTTSSDQGLWPQYSDAPYRSRLYIHGLKDA